MARLTARHWRIDPSTGALTPTGDAPVSVNNPQVSDTLSEPGSGSVESGWSDAFLDEFGYDGLDLIQCLIDDVPAWVMCPDPVKPAVVGPGEESNEKIVVGGPGHLALLGRQTVFPTGGAGRIPKESERTGGWMSPAYDISTLDTAKVILLTQYAKVTWAGGNPFGDASWAPDFPLDGFSVIYWADNPLGNPSDYLSADPGECWFFRDAYYPRDGLYRHFCAADDFIEVFLDSQQILTADSYLSMVQPDVQVTAGWHRLAMHARNGTGTVLDTLPGAYVGPGGFSLEIAEVTLIGLNYIGLPSPDLKVIAYADSPPGVPPITLLLDLMDEYEARGGIPIARSFSATLDSNGNDWNAEGEPAISINSTNLDLVRQLSATDAEFVMDPDLEANGLLLHAYRYGERTSATGKTLTKGVNLQVLEHSRENLPVNALLVETATRWIEVTDAPSIAVYGRSEAALSLGQLGDAEARRVAEGELAKFAAPREEIDATVIVGEFIPYVDGRNGDTVTVADSTGSAGPERLLTTVTTQDGNGMANFQLVFRDAILEPEQRLRLSVRRSG